MLCLYGIWHVRTRCYFRVAPAVTVEFLPADQPVLYLLDSASCVAFVWALTQVYHVLQSHSPTSQLLRSPAVLNRSGISWLQPRMLSLPGQAALQHVYKVQHPRSPAVPNEFSACWLQSRVLCISNVALKHVHRVRPSCSPASQWLSSPTTVRMPLHRC